MPKRKLAKFEGDSTKLIPGTSGAWKFVSRISPDEAVCLISDVSGDGLGCRSILKTTSSSNKSILSHALAFHNIDINKKLKEENEKEAGLLEKFLRQRKFNEIWSFESALCYFVANEGATLNFFQNNKVLSKLFSIAFKREIPSVYLMRRMIKSHAETVRQIIAGELEKEQTISFSFDEWTSSSAAQMICLVVHTKDQDFNLRVIEINTASADAKSLTDLITERLDIFKVKSKVKCITADGAATNSKVARLTKIPIQRCINHAIQLAICDTFYQKNAIPVCDAESDYSDEHEPEEDLNGEDIIAVDAGNCFFVLF